MRMVLFVVVVYKWKGTTSHQFCVCVLCRLVEKDLFLSTCVNFFQSSRAKRTWSWSKVESGICIITAGSFIRVVDW